jgi:hypothetical protein
MNDMKFFFLLVSAFWVLLWLLSGFAAGSVFGDSVGQLSFFCLMAFGPPALAYCFFFRFIPWLRRRGKAKTRKSH